MDTIKPTVRLEPPKHLLLFSTLFLLSCSASNLLLGPTQTPLPTYTPAPTYTAAPTYTPYPTASPVVQLPTHDQAKRFLTDFEYTFFSSADMQFGVQGTVRATFYSSSQPGYRTVSLMLSDDQLIGYAFVCSVVPSQTEQTALRKVSGALGVQDQVLEGLDRVGSGDSETVNFLFEGFHIKAALSDDGEDVIIRVVDAKYSP